VTRAIDVHHLGRDRVICAHEIDGLIVDPGPTTGLDALLAGLGDGEPRALLLTHIHLDHAGASGSLVERFPGLTVYVHERGAPHLVDPERLLRSARQLYGDEMERLWGEVRPVPEASVRALSGGETIEGSIRVEYTPGHASHHVSYLREATGEAFVGDVAGVRIPPLDHVLPPTPPPDIDVEAWEGSLRVLEGWAPTALRLTHFGRVDAVEAHLGRMRVELAHQAELARAHGEDAFVAAVEAHVREAAGEEGIAERYLQAAPAGQLYLGLERYWRKRAEGAGRAGARPDGERVSAAGALANEVEVSGAPATRP
jgi:glyoxylase-like metal-dependent hydrolase (beta-lactamase superfamily II)